MSDLCPECGQPIRDHAQWPPDPQAVSHRLKMEGIEFHKASEFHSAADGKMPIRLVPPQVTVMPLGDALRDITDDAERRKQLLGIIWGAQVRDMPPYIWDLIAAEIGAEVQKTESRDA